MHPAARSPLSGRTGKWGDRRDFIARWWLMTDTKEPKGTISVKCRELFFRFFALLYALRTWPTDFDGTTTLTIRPGELFLRFG